MKRVSIGFIIFYFSWYVAVYICGSPIGAKLDISPIIGVAVFIIWLAFSFLYPTLYPKTLQKRLSKLAEKKNIDGLGFRGDFFIPEAYFIDTTNGYLIGITLFNPFKYQYIDLKNVKDVELVTKVFNQSVVASIRCRLHMEKKKCDIWLYRDARYQPTLDVDSEKEIAIKEAAETIKSTMIEAVEVAKKMRQ